MGRLDFGRSAAYPAPPFPHALHDDDADVVDGDVVEGLDDGLPIQHGVEPEPVPKLEPEPALPLGCRWRVPLTWVHNPSGVLLLYRDQLDAQNSNKVIICKSIWFYSNFIHIDIKVFHVNGKCVGLMAAIHRRVG